MDSSWEPGVKDLGAKQGYSALLSPQGSLSESLRSKMGRPPAPMQPEWHRARLFQGGHTPPGVWHCQVLFPKDVTICQHPRISCSAAPGPRVRTQALHSLCQACVCPPPRSRTPHGVTPHRPEEWLWQWLLFPPGRVTLKLEKNWGSLKKCRGQAGCPTSHAQGLSPHPLVGDTIEMGKQQPHKAPPLSHRQPVIQEDKSDQNRARVTHRAWGLVLQKHLTVWLGLSSYTGHHHASPDP